MGSAPVPRTCGRAAAVLWACLGLIVAGCGPAANEPSRRQVTGEPASSDRPTNGTTAGAIQSAAPPYVPAESRDAIDKRLAVMLDGQTIYIKNGGQVVLGNGLAAEIYLDPYPPSVLSSTMDVYLTLDGRALADGGVEVAYDMLAMTHGPFSAEAKAIGGGHYLVSLDYIEFGVWEQGVTIRIGLQRIHFPVLVVAYP